MTPPKIQTKAFIGTWKEANEFIFRGYRVNFLTWREALCTFCSLHNESFNVWTLAFGFVIGFAILTYKSFTDVGEIVTQSYNMIFD
jgi:hypothetical protein